MNFKVTIEKLYEGHGKLRAIGTVEIDGRLTVHNVRVVGFEDTGLSAYMPSRRDFHGDFVELVELPGDEDKRLFSAAVLRAYNEAITADSE